MSEEVTTQEVNKAEKQRGPRGELGKGSAGKRLKALHAAFLKTNKKARVSLKAFVKTLGDSADAKKWAADKSGANDEPRTKANAELAKTIANATRLTRRKKKSDGTAAAK